MLHSALHPGISGVSGIGIVALRDISLGTVVWGPCADCRVWDAAQLKGAVPSVKAWLDEYGYRLANGKLIVPCMGAHLFNHSCNAAVLDYERGVGLTVRDVKAGEEVTIDYRTFHHELPWEFKCSCRTPACVGTVRPIAGRVPGALSAQWRRRMAPALEQAGRIPQEIALRECGAVLATAASSPICR